jgi:hypothetical protein
MTAKEGDPMIRSLRRAATGPVAALLLLRAVAASASDLPAWEIPTATHTLDNGLTVVVSEDHGSPTFGISVVYKVGFRLEPRGRTGSRQQVVVIGGDVEAIRADVELFGPVEVLE